MIRLFLSILLILLVLFFAGPREPTDVTLRDLPPLTVQNAAQYLAEQESKFADIRPDQQKQIIWADHPGEASAIALIYIHGFSASARELSPLPQQVAQNLGANLYLARLTGHGRSGEAMLAASVNDWVNDVAEALHIGQALGQRVILMATSQGGTLSALALNHPELAARVDAVILTSPNFGLADPMARLLNLPYARHIIPALMGEMRAWEPVNDLHAEGWTHRYPTAALMPMAASLRALKNISLAHHRQPLLLLYNRGDKVVSAAAILSKIDEWGGEVTRHEVKIGPNDDPYAHVLAGDALSPGNTAPVKEVILNWLTEALPH